MTDVLRPQSFDDFTGQEPIKQRLKLLIDAAKIRGERHIDHVLLAGPPGLGKTTLANIIANELDASTFRVVTGPAIGGRKELTQVMKKIVPGEVFFLDEIHRLTTPVQEVMLPILQESVVDDVVGSGDQTWIVRQPIGPFTMVGATTHAGSLTRALKDRFKGLQAELAFYSTEELVAIVKRAAAKLDVGITEDAAWIIASRSRSTARIANGLVARCRDYALVHHGDKITADVAITTLAIFGIDELGLDELSRSILDVLGTRYRGRAVGIQTIAVAIGQVVESVEAAEKYLVRAHLMERTPRGRQITAEGQEHVDKEGKEQLMEQRYQATVDDRLILRLDPEAVRAWIEGAEDKWGYIDQLTDDELLEVCLRVFYHNASDRLLNAWDEEIMDILHEAKRTLEARERNS